MKRDGPGRAAARLAGIAAGGGGVLAAALWAFAPLDAPGLDEPPPSPERNAPVVAPTVAALDRAAFTAPLWIAPTPPPPPSAPAAPAPTPPLNLKLLAIIKDSEDGTNRYKAMVYDLNAERVLVVAAGESLGGRMVESIDPTALRIKDGGGTRTLTLKTEGGIK